MTTQLLIEQMSFAEAELREDGTVKQVLIRAGKSANGRLYRADVLERATSIFEGVRTYSGHPTARDIKERRERTPLELTGWISNVRFEEGALVGERHFAATDAGEQARRLVEQVVTGKAPASLIGASINAFGSATKQKIDGDEVYVIEDIAGAHSVDDVVQPAAGGGFPLAASAGGDLVGALLEHLTYEEWQEHRSDYAERLKAENRKVRRNAQIERATQDRDKYRTRFESAQAELKALQETHAEQTARIVQLEREVLVIETLAAVKLPLDWKAALREDLLSVETDKWQSIIQREIGKAKRVQAQPKPRASGHGVQVAEAVQVLQVPSMRPLPHENAAEWWQRVRGSGLQ